MRLAFWRRGGDKSADVEAAAQPVQVAIAEPAVSASSSVLAGDIDLRALGEAITRNRRWIILPTLLALALSVVAVNLITPRYRSEARILIDGRENVFLRPNGERNEERPTVDAEAVTSQVQLLLSRDLAREIIKKNRLAELPEFDPVLTGLSPVKSLLALVGIGRDPFTMTPEERVLDAYFERLTVYAVDKSRVIVVEFQSRDPDLAARVANSIADGYLVLQQNARREQAKSASQWLSGEIDSLRRKVAEDEAKVEEFRSRSSLFIGTNNTTLSNQQLGELNTQLNNARALKSDAEAKARLIREMLQSGKPIEAAEVLNSELIRRLSEQRVTLRAQLAEQSSTLLDNHPRIKELKAQLNDLDQQIRDEAAKLSRSLENDARIAGGRVESLSASLDQLKKQATSSNGQDVQLRALEREAKAQRDLLESYLAKYREANTRETIDAAPSDGRIISRALVSNTPAYPKKLPVVLIATLATLLLSTGLIVTGELLRMTAPRAMAVLGAAMPASVAAAAPEVAAAPVAAGKAADAPRIEPTLPVLEEAAPPLTPPVSAVVEETAENLGEIDRLAEKLRRAGAAAHKITVLGTAGGEAIMLTALTLARRLALQARVVVVDLEASSPAIAAVSVDPVAPGIAELMQGAASFSQVITRDRLSRVHLVSAGRPGFDRSLLQSPRLSLAIDALLRVYDHVLLNAGLASDLPAELLTAKARAIVVPDAAMDEDARRLMRYQLEAVGFAEVTMLDKPVQPGDPGDAAPKVVAA
ncbi:MAG TPA: exopolysaccharide transport family protein [Bradyrhizobium sp.]|nr:exopolysaccharide transport family protein [Bradyrhizobium sp.]